MEDIYKITISSPKPRDIYCRECGLLCHPRISQESNGYDPSTGINLFKIYAYYRCANKHWYNNHLDTVLIFRDGRGESPNPTPWVI